MLGHELKLSETNLRGWVPVCACGWVGTVSAVTAYRLPETQRLRFRIGEAKERATAEHGAHLNAISNEIARVHADALASHSAYIDAVTPTVRRIGRWGSG